MELVLKVLAAGALAALAMTTVMFGIHKLGLAQADMIRALGSLLTKSRERSLVPGLITHLLSGAMFALPYAFLVGALPLTSMAGYVFAGGLLGLFHGFVFSFLLVAFVAESHPLEEYRRAGLSVAGAHILGHIAYGCAVSALVFLFNASFGFKLIGG